MRVFENQVAKVSKGGILVYLEKIMKLISPPASPCKPGDGEGWGVLENQLGTKLPWDYKQFITNYGTGSIDEFLWFLTPFVKDEYGNFLVRSKVLLDAYLVTKEKFPEDFKHEVFPTQGGLLPWGYTIDGDVLYWNTTGQPDKWSVVIYDSRAPEYVEYSYNISKFLYEILQGRIICHIFPEGFPSGDSEFISVEVE